jgi:hypothetical protein
MRYIAEHLNRARYILENEGAISLLRRTFSYLASHIFFYDEYYLLRLSTGELNEADFLPRTEDFTFKLINSNEVADDWAKQTGFDFREQILHARRHLDAGAIAFCTFVPNCLASIIWAGFNQKAKDSLQQEPYNVNFSERQGCMAGGETAPQYRGERLNAYAWFRMIQYMKEQDITMLIGLVGTDKLFKLHTKFPMKIYAKARYVKFLRWQYWKETPPPRRL